MRHEKRRNEDVKEHIRREVDWVPKRSVQTSRRRKAWIQTCDTEELEECMRANNGRNGKGHLQECAPQFFRRKHHRRDNKVKEEVCERYPSIHALIVTPEALERIRAKDVSKCDDNDKDSKCS